MIKIHVSRYAIEYLQMCSSSIDSAVLLHIAKRFFFLFFLHMYFFKRLEMFAYAYFHYHIINLFQRLISYAFRT